MRSRMPGANVFKTCVFLGIFWYWHGVPSAQITDLQPGRLRGLDPSVKEALTIGLERSPTLRGLLGRLEFERGSFTSYRRCPSQRGSRGAFCLEFGMPAKIDTCASSSDGDCRKIA